MDIDSDMAQVNICGSCPTNGSSPRGGAQPSCYKPKPISSSQSIGGTLQYVCHDYPLESLEIMNHLRHQQQLCDVILKADDEAFPAHRLVLASASPYFKAMFCNGMMECSKKEISMQGVRANTLASLIDFAYTSEITVSEMNVCQLLPVATMLHMQKVVDACCLFLYNQLDPTNCLGIADFAQAHGCHDLYGKARTYLYQHFSDVCQNSEFLDLSAPQVKQVIKRDELNVRCESDVYGAVLRWVMHDPSSRANKLEDLLTGVRCHFLIPAFLREQLERCDILKKEVSCHAYLSRVLCDLTEHKPCLVRRRTPPAPVVIYVIGGYNMLSLSHVECFNPDSKEWMRVADLPFPRSGVGVGTVHGLIYVLGGRNNSPESNSDTRLVDVFDPFMNLWRSCAEMKEARNRVGVGVIDGQIYAVGGSAGCTHHKSVERYNPENNTWVNVTPMKVPRIGTGTVVVNRLLFAIGGFDGGNRLRSVECYSPESNEWIFKEPLRCTRSGAGVCVHEQFIYAVGGYDGTSQLASVERYDVELNQWQMITPLLCPRSALNVTVQGGQMFALGGYDGAHFLSSVEAYDFDAEEWTEYTSLSCGRSGHGVTTALEPCNNKCLEDSLCSSYSCSMDSEDADS